MMGAYGDWGAGWGAMGWSGGLLLVAFWVALILLVVLAIRALFPGERRNAGDPALEMLRRRYAAWEITQAAYEQARRVLERGRTAAGSARRR